MADEREKSDAEKLADLGKEVLVIQGRFFDLGKQIDAADKRLTQMAAEVAEISERARN